MKMSENFVFDTNTLISAFLFENSIPRKALSLATRTGRLTASSETHSEFKEVIFRTKFDRYFGLNGRQKALDEINGISIFLEINERITACRDPKDDKFLELVVSAKASCIISGDEDLLVLNPFRGIPILKAVEFCY